MTLTELIARFKAKIPFATNAAPVNQKLVADELVAVGLAFEAQQSTNEDVAIELTARALVAAGLRTDLNAALVRIATLEEGAGTPAKAATPTSFAAGTPTATTVPLSWAGPTGATYVVQRSLTSDFNAPTSVYTGTATTTTATGLTASTGYYARVKAQVAGLTDSDWATLQLTTAAPAPQTDLSRFAFAGEGSNPENGNFFRDLSGHNNHMPVVGMELTRDGDKVQVIRADFGGSYNSGLAPTFSGTTTLSLYALIDLFEEDPFYFVTKSGFALGVNDAEVGAWYTGAATGFFPCPIGRLRALEWHLDSAAGTGEVVLDGTVMYAGAFTGNPFPAGCTIGFGGGGSRAFHGALHALDIRTSGVDSEEQRQEMRAYLAAYHAQAPLVPDAVDAVPQAQIGGDSRVEGVGSDTLTGPYVNSPVAQWQAALGASAVLINNGHGGDTTEILLINRMPGIVSLYDGSAAANVFILSIGINDETVNGASTPLATTISRKDEVFRRMHARGYTPYDATVIIATYSTQPRHDNLNALVLAYDAAHPELIAGTCDEGAIPELLNPVSNPYFFDEVHQKAAGSRLKAICWHRTVAPALRNRGIAIPTIANWDL